MEIIPCKKSSIVLLDDLESRNPQPRNMTAGQIVEYWLEMYETKDVMEWYDHMEVIDMPSLQLSFAGMFGHIMLLEWGYNRTVTIATPFLGRHFDQISELDSPHPITD